MVMIFFHRLNRNFLHIFAILGKRRPESIKKTKKLNTYLYQFGIHDLVYNNYYINAKNSLISSGFLIKN